MERLDQLALDARHIDASNRHGAACRPGRPPPQPRHRWWPAAGPIDANEKLSGSLSNSADTASEIVAWPWKAPFDSNRVASAE